MQFEYVFTPGDSGTRVQLNFSGKGKGLLYRSMFAFIKGSLIAGQEANLQQLAEVLNRNRDVQVNPT